MFPVNLPHWIREIFIGCTRREVADRLDFRQICQIFSNNRRQSIRVLPTTTTNLKIEEAYASMPMFDESTTSQSYPYSALPEPTQN